MPNPTVYSSAKQFVALAKEVTQGGAAAPTATMPVEKFEAEDKQTWLDDVSMRGSMTEKYARVAGVGHVEWSMSGPWYADTIGYLLSNMLGDVATTGASAPFTHAFTLLNSGNGQPGSLTLVDFQGPTATVASRSYSGCCVSELTLKGNAESSLIMFEAKGIGSLSQASSVMPTSSPSTEVPVAAWRYLLGLAGPASGGTLVSTTSEFEVTLKRDLQTVFTGQNQNWPYWIQRGKLTASGKLAFAAAADETPLTYLLSNTQPQLQLKVDNGVTPTSSASYRAMTIDVQKAAWTTSKINRSTPTVGYDVEFDAIATTTNAGSSGGYAPCKITVVNATASGTY